MRYWKHSDFVSEHLLQFLVGDRWEKAINGAAESGQLRTEWTREWVEGHKGQSMEEALSEFVDERLLRILRIKTVLRTGVGAEDKRPYQWLNELRSLCAAAPILRGGASTAAYASTAALNAMVHSLSESVRFDFDEGDNRKAFSLKDEAISLVLSVKGLFGDGSNDNSILVQIFEMNTLSFYRDTLSPFDVTMNLDGLRSKYRWTIPLTEGQPEPPLDGEWRPFLLRKYAVSFPPELVGKRGVFMVDCIASGRIECSLCNDCWLQ